MSVETVVPSKVTVLSEHNVPIEELLGSVTTYNNVEGSEAKSQQLRTSARVFKKMKLDSANAVPSICDKKESVKEETKPEIKKPLRPTWSQEDKNLFFEALNDYGKEFEAIHSYISNKLKKKGLPESVLKTKDQIRHFYYRTWHKISKYLRFCDDVKKIAQELYALINYGELRKKVGSVSEKTCMKLNELIYRGTIAVRIKGKTVRIKTPMCRALRKLNRLDDTHDDLKLPTRINVELRPKDMNSWLRVQGMSQNPRIKTAVPLQRRLSTLINCMSTRWKPLTASAYDKAIISTSNVTNDCVPDKKTSEGTKIILDPPFRLSPPTNSKVELPTINLSEYLTSHSICLNAYEERIGIKSHGEHLWGGKGVTRRGAAKRPRTESMSDKSSPASKIATTMISTDNNENCINDCELPTTVNDVVDEAVNTILALQNQDLIDTFEEKYNEQSDIKTEVCDVVVNQTLEKEQDVVKIQNGWTIHDCGTISIGEVYLMCGSDSTLVLEYSWDSPASIKVENDGPDKINDEFQSFANAGLLNISSETTSESNLVVNEENLSKSFISNDNNLSTTLQRLLSLAKLHYRKNIVHCPCGHVCGTGSKNTNVIKNKSVSSKTAKVMLNEKTIAEGQEKFSASDNTIATTDFKESLVPIIIQPHIRQFSPVTLFRRPNSPSMDMLKAQLDSIQQLRPRYSNRRGRRPRAKQVVVERKLPLVANNTDSGRIVQMNIISQQNIAPLRTIAPHIVDMDNDKNEHSITIMSVDNKVTCTSAGISYKVSTGLNNESTKEVNFNMQAVSENLKENMDNNINNLEIASNTVSTAVNTPLEASDNAVTVSRVGSPTSISNLLDMALTPPEAIIFNNEANQNKDSSAVPSFEGLLAEGICNSTPPTSPSRILKESDNQWLNSEVADFSLSSFLGQLGSPIKPTQSSSNMSADDTRMSQDVDAQLQSLLTESSIDYMAKFADLAAQVVSDAKR